MPAFLYILPVPRFFSQNHGEGGHVAHVRGILRALHRRGYEPVVLTAEDSPALYVNGAHPVCELPCTSRDPATRAPWSFRLVREAARLSARHAPAFAYVRYSAGFAPWLPRLRAALQGTPLVVEVNSLGSQRHTWLRRVDRRALRDVDLIVCVSEVLAEFVRDLFGGDRCPSLLMLPNGVDAERFAAAKPDPALATAPGPRIGYCGVFKPGYGLEELIEGTKLARERGCPVQLHLFGDGPQRSELERLAGGAEHIHFHGMVGADRIPAVLQSLDVLVGTTSQAHRFQSPIKLYEYMASGRPIVFAGTPQTEAVLGDGARGLLYDPGSPQSLAAQIERLLTDAPLAATLGAAAQSAARAEHSWDSRVERMLDSLPSRFARAVLPQSGDALEDVWQWYLNLPREMAAGLFSEAERTYLTSYYEEAGLLNHRRRTFFKWHYAATFAEAASFLLEGRSNPAILDLGCGTGTQSLYFALRGARVVGVDMDDVALAIFRKRIAFYEQLSGKRLDITLCHADSFEVDYPAHGPFDGVYSMFAFNMMQPSARLLELLRPHLRPGCRLAVVDGNNRSWRARLLPSWRRSVWSPQEFRGRLEQHGFEAAGHHGGICLPPVCWRLVPERWCRAVDRRLLGNWLTPVSHQILARLPETAVQGPALVCPSAARVRSRIKV